MNMQLKTEIGVSLGEGGREEQRFCLCYKMRYNVFENHRWLQMRSKQEMELGGGKWGVFSFLRSTFSFCLPLAPHRLYILITLLWSRMSKGFPFLIKNIHKLLQVTCEFICLEKNQTLPKLTTPLIRPLVSTSCPWGNYWYLLVWCLFMHLSRSCHAHTYTDLLYVQGLIMHSVPQLLFSVLFYVLQVFTSVRMDLLHPG